MSDQTTVLIVEDESTLREAYKIVLNSNDYRVLTAANGVEALTLLKNRKVNIMLLDMFMPKMDGITFLKNLDKSMYPGMRIIVCSNLSDSNTKSEAMEMGADRYIMKSDMNPADLIKLIKSVEDEIDKP